MSRFTNMMATSQALTLAAWEEASRMGQRTADVDHLLLALVIDKSVAGQILRSEGITLESARKAVVDQHASQLATLGINAEAQTDGQIVFYETDGYEWGERPARVIERASKGGNKGDSIAVLRELVTEPSGLVSEILQRLEVSPDGLLQRLDEADRALSPEQRSSIYSKSLSGTFDSFVPAPTDEVWSLLSTPGRMPEWETSVSRLETIDPERPEEELGSKPGDAWLIHVATELPGGKDYKVKPQYATQRVEVLEYEEGSTIAWRFSYPDAPQANSRFVRIALEPAAGGTQLRISYAWERKKARRRIPVLSWLMRPLYRWAIYTQVSHLGGSIGRVFR